MKLYIAIAIAIAMFCVDVVIAAVVDCLFV